MVETKTVAKKIAKKAKNSIKKPAKKVVKKVATKRKSSSQYAVFATGGKQYRVSEGDILKIEKIKGDHKEGDRLIFDKVLLVDDGATEATIGTPFINGAKIEATIKAISRNKKVSVVKYKSKSRYFRRYGHRQPYFEITIDSIK